MKEVITIILSGLIAGMGVKIWDTFWQRKKDRLTNQGLEDIHEENKLTIKEKLNKMLDDVIAEKMALLNQVVTLRGENAEIKEKCGRCKREYERELKGIKVAYDKLKEDLREKEHEIELLKIKLRTI